MSLPLPAVGSTSSSTAPVSIGEEQPLPTYRVHLSLFANSAVANSASASAAPTNEQQAATSGWTGDSPSLASLPQDWREGLAELRQAGAYFLPASPSQDQSEAEGSAFNIFSSLPNRKKRRIDSSRSLTDLPRRRTRDNTPALDQRFGPIRIDWADHIADTSSIDKRMRRALSSTSQPAASAGAEEQAAQASTSAASSMEPRSNSHSGPSTSLRAGSSSDQGAGGSKLKVAGRQSGALETPTPVARFFQTSSFNAEEERPRQEGSFEAGSTDVAFGVVHLFRDRTEASAQLTKVSDNGTNGEGGDSQLGTVLAVLAVPSTMTASDFLSFVEPAVDVISHMRMIR